MAASFTAIGNNLATTANKNMISFFNTSPTLVTRIYRMWVSNPRTATVPGGIGIFTLGRIGSAIAGSPTAITPAPHNPAATTLTGLTVNTAGTLATLTSVFRQIAMSGDEIAAGGATIDEIHNVFPLNVIWDAGYGDTNVEPITLRENQGCSLISGALGTYSSNMHIHVEFTHS